MKARQWLQQSAMTATDAVAASMPRPVPSVERLRDCKIIAHRGEHDNAAVVENTLAAFELARANGVWGIECDVRWTADLVPVICHDPDGERLHGCPEGIHTMDFSVLRQRMPAIPSLAEVVAEFGGNTHLMLEVKAAPFPEDAVKSRILADHLAGLVPGRDYHVLLLAPELLAAVAFLPPRFCYLVAELNTGSLSRAALELGCGGLAGHYLLMGRRLMDRHREAGQGVGTGFVASRHCLYREINRGVDWIFSNDAVRLQQICNRP